MAQKLLLSVLLFVTVSCGTRAPAPQKSDAPDRVRKVAQEFVDGYYHQFPEEAYEVGYPDTPMDRLGDRSAAAMAAWRAKEDGWLAILAAIDPGQLEGTDAAIPYAFTRDRLEASVARRVCHTSEWNISPTWTGWQAMLSSTFGQQPISTDAERATALTRLRAVPAYLDTEIANARAGMAAGYLAPVSNVRAVIAQADAMLAGAPDSSPFFDPAARAKNTLFAKDVGTLLVEAVNPAIRRYRDFLQKEYRGRDAVGVSANPDGAACYAASLRFHTSLSVDSKTVHDTGLQELARIEGEMQQIAREYFKTSDVKGLLNRLRTDRQYTFKTEADVLAYARAAVDRAAVRVHDWFGFVPDAKLVVKPFPAYQKASGGGFYAAGSQDGTRPGTYELGTYQPQTISKVGMESTAFHESYPGHHLQMSVALFGKGVHPVLRYIYVSSMAEGWGLYSERLADEMKLYSSEIDRLGMLSGQSFRAARLVVDSGLHTMSWSREQAITFMLDHSAESRAYISAEIDRYLAVPGQATSYMLGRLEIQKLRKDAERQLGARFDIKGFHDVILRDGAVTLPMLRVAVARWIRERGAS
ncbi:MAG TPA: DUF885 domain-containing protein [Vicinamibacterales bacterium]|nr:DUF885 domain-containing protein [Vicinamibacterales bacterium]